MKHLNNEIYKVYTEQPVETASPILSPAIQEQMAFGSIALGTMVCMTVLIREIRLLILACKS